MKIQEIKLKSFKKRTPAFKFLFFPMLILGLLALSIFVASSFWKYDFAWAEFFSRGMKYSVVKFWTQLYLVIGNTELLVPLFVLIMILVESIFKKQIEKKSDGFFSRCRWIVLVLYGLIIGLWLGFNIYEIVSYNWANEGFGPGINKWTFNSLRTRQIAKILIFLFQTSFLIFGSYYVHFTLINKKQFWKQEYWIDTIKALTFFALTYILVAFLKGLLSRPYYYNVIFGDLLNDLTERGRDDLVEAYKSQNLYQYGFNHGDLTEPINGWISNIDGKWPWYRANGYFNPLPGMPRFDSPINYAFPSGHVNATYCMASTLFLVLGKNRKFNWIHKLLLGLFLIHVLSMTFALLTMRGHWVSDLTFTHVWALMMFPIVNLIVNKIMQKIRKKD